MEGTPYGSGTFEGDNLLGEVLEEVLKLPALEELNMDSQMPEDTLQVPQKGGAM